MPFLPFSFSSCDTLSLVSIPSTIAFILSECTSVASNKREEGEATQKAELQLGIVIHQDGELYGGQRPEELANAGVQVQNKSRGG